MTKADTMFAWNILHASLADDKNDGWVSGCAWVVPQLNVRSNRSKSFSLKTANKKDCMKQRADAAQCARQRCGDGGRRKKTKKTKKKYFLLVLRHIIIYTIFLHTHNDDGLCARSNTHSIESNFIPLTCRGHRRKPIRITTRRIIARAFVVDVVYVNVIRATQGTGNWYIHLRIWFEISNLSRRLLHAVLMPNECDANAPSERWFQFQKRV